MDNRDDHVRAAFSPPIPVRQQNFITIPDENFSMTLGEFIDMVEWYREAKRREEGVSDE